MQAQTLLEEWPLLKFVKHSTPGWIFLQLGLKTITRERGKQALTFCSDY